MSSTLVMVCTLLAASLTGQAKQVGDLFESHQYRCAEGRYKGKPIEYRLFVPRDMHPTERYPLFIWMPGVYDQLKWAELWLDDLSHPEKYRFFLLIPYCPPGDASWFHGVGESSPKPDQPDDMLAVIVAILRTTMQKHPVDENRVYVTGISAGGSGCWEMIQRYPELFAAAVPMSSGGGDVSRAEELKNIPIWAFHNLDDGATPPDGDKATVAAVNLAGGNAHLTFPPSSDDKHDSWSAAFRRYNIVSWMLAQRRGGLCWLPPGCRPWKWRHILAMPAAFLAIAWLAWLREKRKLRRRQASVERSRKRKLTSFCACRVNRL